MVLLNRPVSCCRPGLQPLENRLLVFMSCRRTISDVHLHTTVNQTSFQLWFLYCYVPNLLYNMCTVGCNLLYKNVLVFWWVSYELLCTLTNPKRLFLTGYVGRTVKRSSAVSPNNRVGVSLPLLRGDYPVITIWHSRSQQRSP